MLREILKKESKKNYVKISLKKINSILVVDHINLRIFLGLIYYEIF